MTDLVKRATRSARPLVRWWVAVCLPLVCGCGFYSELPTYYGRHEIGALSASVNGTDVLAGMFSEAGHRVYFRTTLVTSQMEDADTIVWVPDDYGAPSDEVVDWFETWLASRPGRTVIYVGRDYNGELQYWKAMLPRVSGEQEKEYKWRMDSAELVDRRPPTLDDEQRECLWFLYEQPEPADDTPDAQQNEPGKKESGDKNEKPKDSSDEPPGDPMKAIPYREVRALRGPWATGIDPSKSDIRLRTQMIPEEGMQELLTSGDDLLVARHSMPYADRSQLILVANGSFLLNLPLVNHEHRKLAAKLIEIAGSSGSVVFLESGPGGPPIDPPHTDNSIWTLFGAFPLNAILLQLAVAGVIFCFARWPIFGRPQRPPPEPASDFARHVAAVGQLLSRTKDRRFVTERMTAPEQPTSRPLDAVVVQEAVPPSEPKGM